jgi:hypothetical protein
MKRTLVVAVVLVVVVAVFLVGLVGSGVLNPKPAATYTRAGAIPATAVKVTPSTDVFPPILLSGEWEAPVPMPGPVNTAGAEDSPFITPDGQTFLFFFTPDVQVPAAKQLLDHVTGIWYTTRSGSNWTEPARVVLSNDLALDGCPFLQGTTLWFCSARVGNYRGVDLYTAQFANGAATNVANAGSQLNQEYKAGEIALSPDGQTMYWGSGDFTSGTNVLYQSNKTATGWDTPFRMANVNNVSNAFLPFVTSNGTELWFTAPSGRGNPGPAVYRSLRQGAGWGTPVEIVSQFAAEPTLDAQGNLYFVHHYFRANMTMIESDIYVAYHKGVASASVAASAAPSGDVSVLVEPESWEPMLVPPQQ